MSRRTLLLVRLGLCFCVATAAPWRALAQTPDAAPQVQAIGTPDAAAPTAAERPVVPQHVTIETGRGQMLQLPEPAASVIAADPSIARVQPASPTRLFVIGAAAGVTTIVATNAAGDTISQFEVTVGGGTKPAAAVAAPVGTGDGGTSANPAAVREAIMQAVRGARDIKVLAANKDLVITGIVPTPAAAQEAVAIARSYTGGEKAVVIDQLLVLSSIQVNVRVRFAEISRTITRELGFHWQALINNGGWRFGMLTGAAAAGAISPFTTLGLTAANGQTPNYIGGGFGSNTTDINSIIDALVADQLVTILAEPNLTALSGETASFLAGGEFPVPVGGSTGNGGTTVTIEFKQFGVSLSVVPTVMASNRLNLRVRPEVSSLTDSGAINIPLSGGTLKIPALSVSRAETTIELGSGQSFAIAGLLKKTTLDDMSGLPGFQDVPVLGTLFKSNSFQREDTELVIIVTPYVVVPASSPSKLQAPTDGFKPPTDLERILHGRQIAGGAGSVTPQIDAGFILR